MSDPYVGEIRMFAGNFAPSGWALCNGQLLPIAQNTALFSLLGVNYGGDGRSTFGLPNLVNRLPMQAGQGPGLSPTVLGQAGGESAVTLSVSEMPSHRHALMATTDTATNTNPTPRMALAQVPGTGEAYRATTKVVPMATEALVATGSSQPHNNQSPALTLTFIIALQGIYPPRS